jgi:hypothetical protein
LAKAKGRKLKVFQTQVGFYDSVVAVPSQAAALRAWGTHQNLFTDGQAKLATDEAAIQAALKHPEVPLRRAVGSTDAFALEPTSLPKVPDAPKRMKPQKPAEPVKAKAAPTPPADRSKLDAAEAAVHTLDDRRRREETAFKKKQAALDAEIEDAQSAYVKGRKAATSNVVQERKSYREAGGRD